MWVFCRRRPHMQRCTLLGGYNTLGMSVWVGDHFQVHPEFGDFRECRPLGGSIANSVIFQESFWISLPSPGETHVTSSCSEQVQVCVCVCVCVRVCVCVCVCAVGWCNLSTSCYGFCCSIAIIAFGDGRPMVCVCASIRCVVDTRLN